VEVAELAPGLWRWTARQTESTPVAGGAVAWDADVGSVYCEAFGDVVLVDPVLPVEETDRERFWRALDRDAARAARPLRVLLTCGWHARGSQEILARYPGATIWEPGRGDDLPGRVIAVDAALPGEVLLWLPSHAALVTGDTLLGDGAGGIQLCPDRWLGDRDPAAVRSALRDRLRPLPVERVLTAHGAPVLRDGRDALTRALGGD
jgi:glyoxylase-like metal-dependent hydrolase (beta-lactamase superfamily II)